MTKFIRGFTIGTNTLNASANTVPFSINGDNGAVFSLQIKRSNGDYYNFKSASFTSAHNSTTRLANVKLEETYNSSIQIPANASGDTYTVYLWGEPHFNTEITSVLTQNPILYTIDIFQIADSTITFTPVTTNTTKFATMPSSITSTGSILQSGVTVVDVDWTISTASTDAGGFGLLLSSQPKIGSWYVSTTDTVDGAITSAYNLYLDDMTGIEVGMSITAVSSGSLSGTPTIVSLNKDLKIIKLSTAQTFADGITLTFKADSLSSIQDSTGSNIKPIDITAATVQLTKTVRGAISNSTTINLNGTYGISKGGTVRGVGFSNSEANPIVSVSASSSAGSMVVTANQTLTAGTKLYIDGCSNDMTIKGKIEIHKYPTSNQTVYLDLDGIFTPGTAS